MNRYAKAYQTHKAAAHAAWLIYVDYCEGNPPPRVPGMDTVIRLAWRIECGRSVVEAAAKEYVYRWHLAIKAPDQCDAGADTALINPCASIFGAPHTIGM